MVLNKKKLVKGLAFMMVVVASMSVVGCKNKSAEGENANVVKDMKIISAKDVDLSNVQLIDTRDESQYIGWKNENGVSGHIKGAMDFPADWLDYEKKAENINIELERRNISKDKKTVLYDNGSMTKEDFDKYANLGFKDVCVLKGGINEYAKNNEKNLDKLPGYQIYVSPQWVQDLTDGKNPEGYNGENYKIVEIYLPFEKEDYDKGHIKGAIKIDAEVLNEIVGPREVPEYENIPIEEQREIWGLPKDKDIQNILEENGIDKHTMVVLYASEKTTTAANRAAFILEYAGVKNVKLLNGGKALWNLEKRPLSTEAVTPEKVDFKAQVPQKPEIQFDYKKENELIKDENAVIASVRSWDEYLGKKSGYTYIAEAGDIKGSRFAYAGSNPYAMEDYRNLDNTLFNYNLIANRWKLWGITPDKTVSFHCGTGWRASETYYVAKALGWENIGVYVGGWYQWTKYPGSPVKEKGLPKDAPEKQPQEFFYEK